ncbi:MAG: hypothetical protein EKK61_04600 [Rickettsiales bacterium]|nr:MAG: hypothetical protein EKK61_04600 [Rickettsiales bacterium]
MIKKDKNNLINQKDVVQKESKRDQKFGYFIFIILFVILAIIYFLRYLEEKSLYNVDSPSILNEINQVEDSSENQVDNLYENNLSYEEDFDDPLGDNLYEDEIICKDCFECTKSDDLNKKIDQYRIFLANADRMISKFRNNENYALELENFNSMEHPEEIKNILNMLKIYNDQLMQEQSITQEMILFPNNNFLSKIIKITKISVEDNKHLEMKKQILERLIIFSDYIYAADLQNKFLNH